MIVKNILSGPTTKLFRLATGPLIFLVALFASETVAAYSQAEVDSINSLGRGYIFSNIEQSVEQYGELALLAQGMGYRAGEARALQHQGVALYLNGQYETGVKTTLQSIRLFEELGLQHELALAYGELGYEMKNRDLDRAGSFMSQAISIAEVGRDSTVLCTLYDNYGVIKEMGDRPDSAAFYYRRALSYKMALNDSLGIPYSLNNLSGIAAGEGRIDEAKRLLRKSDAYRHALPDSFGLILNSVQWGELLFVQGELPAAAERFRESLQMPNILEHGYLVSYCYERLSAIYEEMENYQLAYQNHLRHTAYRDSLSSGETVARIAALELEFESEKKDRELAENRLHLAKRSRQILGLLATVVVLLLAGTGAMRFQQLRRRQLQQEMEWQGRLRRAEYEQRIADEKLRISRELHDNIGARLTFMTSSVDNISYQSEDSGTKLELHAISEFGRGTLNELRQTVWAMKNEDEGLQALVEKLHELKMQCATAGRQLTLETKRGADVPVDLTSGRMLNLYRIAQEAVQNATKHTAEAAIEIELTSGQDELVLCIRDTGPGFNTAVTGHLGGLANMRARCQESGGEFHLNSGAGGTEIICRFPVK